MVFYSLLHEKIITRIMKRELNYYYMGGEGGEQIEKLHNNTFQGIYLRNFCHKVYFTQFGCLFLFPNKRIFPSCNGPKFTSICIQFYVVFNMLHSNVSLPFFNTFYRQYCCLPSIRYQFIGGEHYLQAQNGKTKIKQRPVIVVDCFFMFYFC